MRFVELHGPDRITSDDGEKNTASPGGQRAQIMFFRMVAFRHAKPLFCLEYDADSRRHTSSMTSDHQSSAVSSAP